MAITDSKRIAYWRKVAGLRPIDLARACGVAPSTVHEWENDGRPTIDSFKAIAKACGVSMQTFWGDISEAEARE